jgi:sugar/nucleoside kinase (ribokinase family)
VARQQGEKTMCDVIGLGANSVDFVYRLPHYPRPDSAFAKIRISDQLVSCGGQVTTALATCVAMGLRTSYIGTTGSDDNGGRMRDELTRLGIDLSHAIVRDGPNPFAVILLDDHEGERVVLWKRDPRVALGARDIDPDAILSARLLHVDDVDLDASVEAARIARTRGLPVTSDIEQATDGVRALIAAVTVPIFAEHVPTALTGEADMARALKAIRQPHHAIVCVTLGARGAMLLEGDTVYLEPGMQVTTVDTTGAGDVFRGAFIHALLRGDAPRDTPRFANTTAAMSCTKVGAMSSVPALAEVTAFAAAQRLG